MKVIRIIKEVIAVLAFIIFLSVISEVGHAQQTGWSGEGLPYFFEDFLLSKNSYSGPRYQSCLRDTGKAFTASSSCITADELSCLSVELYSAKNKNINVTDLDHLSHIDLNKNGKIDQSEIDYVNTFMGCYYLGDRNLDGRVGLAEYVWITGFIEVYKGVSFLYWSNGDDNGDNKTDDTELYRIKSYLNEVPGDANLNGCVDSTDINILSKNWMKTPTDRRWTLGDFNRDNIVDSKDANLLVNNWGKCRPESKQEYILGDYNHDGCVTKYDTKVLSDSYGEKVKPGSGADGDKNGLIDGRDFLILQRNMNKCKTFTYMDLF